MTHVDGTVSLGVVLDSLVASAKPNLDRATLQTAAALVSTAAVLLFTITLIPFQQYATAYSPSLLRYIQRDWRLVVSYVGFFLLITVSLGLLFAPPTFGTVLAAVLCVLLSFAIIGLMWRWSAALLDPRHVLPRIEREIDRKMSAAFVRARRAGPPPQTTKQLREVMRQVMNTHDNHHGQAGFVAVPAEILRAMAHDMQLLQELSGVFLRANHNDLFEAAYGTQLRSLSRYLVLRRPYVGNLDQQLIDFSDILRDYVAVARQSDRVQQGRVIWRGISDLAVQTLDLDVIGSRQGHHQVAHPLVSLMRESIARDLGTDHMDGAFEGVRALGAFATALSQRGFCHSAAELIEELARLARASASLGQTTVTWFAKAQMADASYAAIANRVLVLNYDLPYDRIVEAYDSVLSDPKTRNTPGMTDPVTWWEPELLRDHAIGGLVRVALFPAGEGDTLIEYNLALAGNLIGLLQKHHGDDMVLQNSATHQLYQCGLWLIAFVDRELTLELLLDRADVGLPSERNLQRAIGIIGKLLDWMFQTWIRALRREGRGLVTGDDVMESMLSLYAILMVCNKPHKLHLTSWLEKRLAAHFAVAVDRLRGVTLSDEDWTSLASIARVMERTGFCARVSRALRIMVRRERALPPGWGRLHHFSHIKRPIVTFRQGVFMDLDRMAFGGGDTTDEEASADG